MKRKPAHAVGVFVRIGVTVKHEAIDPCAERTSNQEPHFVLGQRALAYRHERFGAGEALARDLRGRSRQTEKVVGAPRVEAFRLRHLCHGVGVQHVGIAAVRLKPELEPSFEGPGARRGDYLAPEQRPAVRLVVLAGAGAELIGRLVAGRGPAENAHILGLAASQEQKRKHWRDVVSEARFEGLAKGGGPGKLTHQLEAVDEHRSRRTVTDGIYPDAELSLEKAIEAAAIEVVDDPRLL